MTWDDFDAIDAAQRQADADDAQHQADRIAGRTPRPRSDATPNESGAPDEVLPPHSAAAAIAEAERLAWPHPIPPTTPSGPQPTNADGSHRDGYWHGGVWEDRPPRKPLPALEGIRAWARLYRDHLRREEKEP